MTRHRTNSRCRVVAVVAWVLVSLSATFVSASGLSFDITLDRNTLVLGSGASINIEIPLPSQTRSIFVQALYGRVIPIDSSREDVWNGRYEPPDQFYPVLEHIVAAVDTDGGMLWSVVSLELIGQGEVSVRTKPFAQTHVRIGEDLFGPVRADADGRATLLVRVPPGVTHGVDDVGSPVDLKMPRLPRSVVFSRYGAAMNPDSPAPMPLLVLRLDDRGRRDDGDAPQIRADRGTVRAITHLGDGVYSAEYLPPADPGIAKDEISVAHPDDPTHPYVISMRFDSSLKPLTAPEKKTNETRDVSEGDKPVSDPNTLFVSLKGGIAWNAGALLAGGAEFDFGWRPFAKTPLLGLGINAGFLYSTQEEELPDSSNRAGTVLVPLDVAGFVRIPAGRRLALIPEVQLGTTLVFNRILFSLPDGVEIRSAENAALFTMGARFAVEIPIHKGALLAHVGGRLRLGPLTTIDGSLSSVDLMIGYRLFLSSF